jgi:hypothetical protein
MAENPAILTEVGHGGEPTNHQRYPPWQIFDNIVNNKTTLKNKTTFKRKMIKLVTSIWTLYLGTNILEKN